MQILKYVIKSLGYYRKKHFAVLLATALSTAVLTGALIIGDSVQFSLQNIVKKRLGSVSYSIASAERMLNSDLVKSLQSDLNVQTTGLIETNGVAINQNTNLRLNQVNIFGVDSTFWTFSKSSKANLSSGEAYISQNMAQRLNADSGSYVLVRVNVPQTISLNTPFSQDEDRSIALRLQVKSILSDDEFGRFSLKSDQKTPFNIFVSHEYLGKELNQQNKVNLILLSEGLKLETKEISKAISAHWELSDVGLKLNMNEPGKLRLTSDQIFINKQIVEKISSFSSNFTSVFSYLINNISNGKNSTPYSFVSGVSSQLNGNEIIVNEWLANDLKLKIGDSLDLSYYLFGEYRNMVEDTAQFVVVDIKPMGSSWFLQSTMPDFPGLADAGSCNEWEAGVPINFDEIRTDDEDYWDDYKGTPKALIAYEQAIKIWKNEYGLQTALFFENEVVDAKKLERFLLQDIPPSLVGINISTVKENGVNAAGNGVDFGELFLSLSFFVIVAAMLLLVIIYKLNLANRKTEISTLSALGLKPSLISKLILSESALTILLGSFIGALMGLLYNKILIFGLNTIWNDAVYTNALQTHIQLSTLLTGIMSGVVLSFVAVYFIVKKQSKSIVASQIKGSEVSRNRVIIKPLYLAILASLLTIVGLAVAAIFIGFVPSLTLTLSTLLLLSLLLWANVLLQNWKEKSYTQISSGKLILRNLAQNKSRTLVVIALMSLGVFSMLITGANRKTFAGSDADNSNGTGGFNFWAETTLPILYDVNSDSGKEKLSLNDEQVLDSVEFVLMTKKSGNDASCLNLNQVQQPAILGIDAMVFDNRKSFAFSALLPQIDEGHPWLFLNKVLGENTYPVYLDQTVITWGLMKKVGDTLQVISEKGDSVAFVIAGGLNASVFQGHMLMNKDIFNRLYPSSTGAKTMLIDGPVANKNDVQETLGFLLADYGIVLDDTNERMARFYSVTYTYLNVFMLLGGLAVLIGTIGMGLVVMRSLMDRRKEFALLNAIGIKNSVVIKLIFYEYSFMLVLGIAIGIISALLGMLPSFLSNAFSIPWSFLIWMLLAILLNGFVWILLPLLTNKRGSIASVLKLD